MNTTERSTLEADAIQTKCALILALARITQNIEDGHVSRLEEDTAELNTLIAHYQKVIETLAMQDEE